MFQLNKLHSDHFNIKHYNLPRKKLEYNSEAYPIIFSIFCKVVQ